MRTSLTILILFICTSLHAQSNDDSKIIITFPDSIGTYERVRIALVKNDFIVKDLGVKDTIVTYPREFSNIPGFSIAKVIVEKNTVVLSGFFGSKRINDWGYSNTPKNYKPIIFYKGSKGWKLLMQIANEIGGQFTFSK